MTPPTAVFHGVPSVTPDARRCAIYARTAISTARDPILAAFDAQREVCAAHIRSQPGWSWIATFEDHGFRGVGLDRPALQYLLADLEAGKIDVVVVFDVDRLSRSPRELSKLMARFQKAGVSLVVAHGPVAVPCAERQPVSVQQGGGR